MSEKYEFIDAEYATVRAAGKADAPTITQMCRWLAVSKSGFYEWLRHEVARGERLREGGRRMPVT